MATSPTSLFAPPRDGRQAGPGTLRNSREMRFLLITFDLRQRSNSAKVSREVACVSTLSLSTVSSLPSAWATLSNGSSTSALSASESLDLGIYGMQS